MDIFQDNDSFLTALRAEAENVAATDYLLAPLVKHIILDAVSGIDIPTRLLARRLGIVDGNGDDLQKLFGDIFHSTPQEFQLFRQNVEASWRRDPACRTLLQPVLFFKGIAALQAHRAAHLLWQNGRQETAFYLQSLAAQVFDVDIHPAARLGVGIFLDHATGLVIGETAVVGDNVSLLHSVTLGGNGRQRGDRHPKIGDHVLISAGAKVLGNVRVGSFARVAASSVVLSDVPAHATVAGIPARLVRGATIDDPATMMEHTFDI